MSPAPRTKKNNTALIVGAAGVGLLWLWSRESQAAQAVDPRWLAQQELARRQALGSQTAGMDTLGMILKLGGSAVTLGTTAYTIFKKVFDTGTNSDAIAALTKYISDGPTGLTTGVDPSMSLSDMVRSWDAVQTMPGTPITPGGAEDVISRIPRGEAVQTVPLAPGEPVPAIELVDVVEPIPVPEMTTPPPIDASVTDLSASLTLPGSVFDPSSFEGATGVALLQNDGLVRLSLTPEEVNRAQDLVSLWERGDLDFSLLDPDKASWLNDNLPTVKSYLETGDFGVGKFSSPITGDAVMHMLPDDFPVGSTLEPGAVSADLVGTPMDLAASETGQIATLGQVLEIVGTVVAVVAAVAGMAITIMGDLPDYQKAVYCALDAASIAALFIPVVGWIVGLVIQIVKFILQQVLGQGKSHEQREAEETQVLLMKAQEFGKQMAQVLTLKELYTLMGTWSSGYVGGTSDMCIAIGAYLPDGNWYPVGVKDAPGYTRILTLAEIIQYSQSLTVSIQGGVKPENLAQANASLRGVIQQLIPIFVNARAGDFEATKWIVNRALNLWMPILDPNRRYVPSMLNALNTHGYLIDEYPWWREIFEQTAYSLQAHAWGFDTWVIMINNALALSFATFPDIMTWSYNQLQSFAVSQGFSKFTDWRRAFFAFSEGYSQQLLTSQIAAQRRTILQQQLEAIRSLLIGHGHWVYNSLWGGRITTLPAYDPLPVADYAASLIPAGYTSWNEYMQTIPQL